MLPRIRKSISSYLIHTLTLFACTCALTAALPTGSSGSSREIAHQHLRNGAALLEKGRTKEAIKEFRLAVRQDPRFGEPHSELGLALFQIGDVAAAVEALEAAAKLEPSPVGYYNLGVAYATKAKLDRGRQDEASYRKSLDHAVAAFQQAIELGMKTPEVHNNLGLLYQQKGERPAARLEFEKAIKQDPNSPEPHNNLGRLFTDIQDWDVAIAAYRKAIELEPHLFSAHINLIQSIRAKGDVPGEVERYREILKVQPSSAIARCHLGYLLSYSAQIAMAKEELSAAVELDPDFAVAHYLLGQVLERMGDFPAATQHYRRAAVLVPDQASVRRALGNALRHQNLIEEALPELRVATDLDPRSRTARYGLARALQQRGRTEEAMRVFEQVREFSKAESDTQRAAIEVNQAIDYLKQGDTDRAIKRLESAATIKAHLPEAHYLLGIALAQKGEMDRANQEFRIAIEQSPRDPEIYFNYGAALWRQARLGDAAEAFRKVVQLKPENGEAHCYLAQLLLALEKTREAKSHLKQAQELGSCNSAGLIPHPTQR